MSVIGADQARTRAAGAHRSTTCRDVSAFFHPTLSPSPWQGVSPFAVYTILEHAGDWKAAAKALAGMGFGSANGSMGATSNRPEDESSTYPQPNESSNDQKGVMRPRWLLCQGITGACPPCQTTPA